MPKDKFQDITIHDNGLACKIFNRKERQSQTQESSESVGYVHVDMSKSVEFVYLYLWHGREIENADDDMEEIGFEGPCLGPFMEIQTMYNTYIRCMPWEEDKEELFLDFQPSSLCIYYDGKAYGALSIISASKAINTPHLSKNMTVPELNRANK
jgi:hypothetical protein